MIGQYIKQRLKIWIQIALSFLLMFLIYSKAMDFAAFWSGFAFLIVSLIVFRFMDDAGSVTLDRENHPERDYLSASNYRSFLTITSVITLVFLLSVLLVYPDILWLVASLIFMSVILYLLFHRSSSIMTLIPLLKYPILLWCVAELTSANSDLGLMISSFFMMLFYDINDEKNDNSLTLSNSIAVILIGILVFQPWLNWFFVILIIVPVAILLLFSKSLYLKYLPILYYPFCSLFITLYT